jgi:putative peptide zinc metalloprotease protein
MRWLGDRCKNLLFGTPVTVGLLRPGESPIVPIYGMLAWCWKVTVGVSILIAASYLFHGAGILLSAAGIVLWYAVPAWKHWKWITKAKQNGEIRLSRLFASSAIGVALAYGLFVFFAAPATKSAPAIVQFSGEQLLRAGSDGFVQELLVETGQSVVAGQALIVLSSPELELSLIELEKRIEESVILSRIKTRKGELAMAQAEAKNAESLQKQRSEKEALKAALVLKAPADGIVFRRGLEHQLGRFVRAGDDLLSFAQSSTKEVVVTVDQRDWDSIMECKGKPFRILFPGHAVSVGILRRIVPRASLDPLHPSLMATNGGPLAVKPKSEKAENGQAEDRDSTMELLSPRFAIELELTPEDSEALSAGQLGYAFFDAKRQSMGSYLYLAISDWFEQKAELASQTSSF